MRALLPVLQATEGSRVVTVSSVMHWFGQRVASADWSMAAFDLYPLHRRAFVSSYSDAKSALLLLAVALRGRGVGAVSVDPGAVASDIWRYIPASPLDVVRKVHGCARRRGVHAVSLPDNGARCRSVSQLVRALL